MREILFRGKRTDNGEWVEGYYTRVADVHYILSGIFDSLINGIINTRGYKVVLKTVGQFTGLTDKNGKKIFEGDIIKYSTNKFGIINYGIACFNVRDIKSRNNPALDIIFADYSNAEVIGNIYDNPELLEGS